MKHFHCLILLCFLLIVPFAASAQGELLDVVATTTIIADVARNVGGDLVKVSSLIPPDADAHAFQPTPVDAAAIAEADVVLVNGAGLEAFLGGLMEDAAGVQPVVVSNGIELLAFGSHDHEGEVDNGHEHAEAEHMGVLGMTAECGEEEHHAEAEHEDEHEHGGCDPHVWTDPRNVMTWAGNIAEALASADPVNAATYRAKAAEYVEQLTALDEEVTQILGVIPEDKRILVTNHEFFGYFAHAYGFKVVGVVMPGGSTLSEPNLQQLAALIDIITHEGVPAVFAEVSANDQLAEVAARETGINVVTTIYSDSLSAADGPASTYLDYLRYNATVIAEALTEE
jgi:ABC-type Zn uptake system ZnuABC Zn-binding protein ZnuA